MKSKICWLCGKEGTPENPLTDHHAIPQRLNPQKNMTIKLHRACHDIVDKPYISIQLPNGYRQSLGKALKLSHQTNEVLKKMRRDHQKITQYKS